MPLEKPAIKYVLNPLIEFIDHVVPDALRAENPLSPGRQATLLDDCAQRTEHANQALSATRRRLDAKKGARYIQSHQERLGEIIGSLQGQVRPEGISSSDRLFTDPLYYQVYLLLEEWLRNIRKNRPEDFDYQMPVPRSYGSVAEARFRAVVPSLKQKLSGQSIAPELATIVCAPFLPHRKIDKLPSMTYQRLLYLLEWLAALTCFCETTHRYPHTALCALAGARGFNSQAYLEYCKTCIIYDNVQPTPGRDVRTMPTHEMLVVHDNLKKTDLYEPDAPGTAQALHVWLDTAHRTANVSRHTLSIVSLPQQEQEQAADPEDEEEAFQLSPPVPSPHRWALPLSVAAIALAVKAFRATNLLPLGERELSPFLRALTGAIATRESAAPKAGNMRQQYYNRAIAAVTYRTLLTALRRVVQYLEDGLREAEERRKKY